MKTRLILSLLGSGSKSQSPAQIFAPGAGLINEYGKTLTVRFR
jgi:hypothetical protein